MSASATDKKKRKLFTPNLSTAILIGMLLGVACGIFFGEYCAFLQTIGDAFIMLLQMTILPYIVVSLVLGIGGLTFAQARTLAVKAGAIMLIFWGISLVIVLLMPLSFPHWESAAFFSTALLEPPQEVDFLKLYIPANPFYSLANNIVPAVVLFTILTGVALIGIEQKDSLLQALKAASDALVRVTGLIVKLTPVGVFAISAAAAGTMTVDEFGRLQVYLVTYNIACLLLTFWILPMLVMAVTPFKYRDIVGLSRDALVTAFTTGNLFVVLPVLTENGKALFEKYDLKREKTDAYVDVIIPVSFNFPNTGKLLMLLFILFAGWFSGSTLSLGQYPTFIFSGLLSFFGGVDVAMPFMLDLLRIPADMYKLYVVTGIVNGRTATLLAAMNLLVFTLLATSALTGVMKINARKLLQYTGVSLALIFVVIAGSRLYFSFAVKNEYEKDRIIANMQLTLNPTPARFYHEMPTGIEPRDPDRPLMEQINATNILRVGYHKDNLPFTYFNTTGELVGFDIDMAHQLARELGVNLEFIPVTFETMAQLLDRGQVDVVMSGLMVTPKVLKHMTFTGPYMDATLAFIVKDHQAEEFSSRKTLKKLKELKIGIVGLNYYREKIKEYLPQAELFTLSSVRHFFENPDHDLDALLMSAEQGSAWTLLYPQYQAAVPIPDVVRVPVAFAVAQQDLLFADYLSQWIQVKIRTKDFDEVYNHWILGLDSEPKQPRWSVIRNVLGWVE